jgi:chitin deacetylase
MPRVALSFDDGPGPATSALLDLLAARGVRATFFLLGRNLERERAVALRIAREGHTLGNHTHTHARPEAITAAQLVAEVVATDDRLRAIAAESGRPLLSPIPVRLPYGPLPGDHRLAALASLGRTHTHWTGAFQDWVEPSPAPAALAAAMRTHIAEQDALGLAAVIDLHDSSKLFADRAATVEGVRMLLEQQPAEWFTVPVAA